MCEHHYNQGWFNRVFGSTWAHIVYALSALAFIFHLLLHAFPFAVGGYFLHDAVFSHDHEEHSHPHDDGTH